jgi:hypothetical protein
MRFRIARPISLRSPVIPSKPQLKAVPHAILPDRKCHVFEHDGVKRQRGLIPSKSTEPVAAAAGEKARAVLRVVAA